MADADNVQKPWRKNLYENLGYPDNYTHESFLTNLRRNVYKQDVSSRQAILTAGVVTEKLCIVVVFSAIFAYLHNNWLQPETLFSYSNGTVCLLYLYYMKRHCSLPYRETLARSMRMVVIFLVFCYILSPLLKTLTDTISTDTIYATASIMLILHLVFSDYNYPAGIVSSSLSLNSAIFSSICLASRLQTPFHAFVFLTLSTELFVLYPYFSRAAVKITIPFLITIAITTLGLVASVSYTMSFVYFLIVLFINVVCPCLFTHWQKYKDNIYGPWDEVIIEKQVKIKKI